MNTLQIIFLNAALLLLSLSSPSLATEPIDKNQLWKRDDLLAQFKDDYGADVETFFGNRNRDPRLDTCRANLKIMVGEYRKARAAKNWARMRDLIQGKAKVGKLKLARDEKSDLVHFIQACGPCVANVTQLNNQFEYKSRAFCQSLLATPVQKKAGLDGSSNYLLTLPNYTKDFNYILQFDGKNQKYDTLPVAAVSPVNSSPFLASIGVKAIDENGFGYMATCTYEHRVKEAVPNFVLQFKGIPNLTVSRPKTVVDVKIGLNSTVNMIYLDDVEGGWLVDGNGFLVYQTRALFPTGAVLGNLTIADIFGAAQDIINGVDGITQVALQVLMDSIFTVFDKFYPGEIS